MSDYELDWQKNVKPIKCEKVTLNDPTLKTNYVGKFSKETHGKMCDAFFVTEESKFHKRFNANHQINVNHGKHDHHLVSCKNSLNTHSLDHNTKLKVDKGKYCIDDRLDLHGYNTESAYHKLTDFIMKNYHKGNRCLLVITGYGNSINSSGAIKNNLHKWLGDTKIHHVILYFQQATNAHGGKGAFYILLRRNKNLETVVKKWSPRKKET